mmetsp:Transcript_8522/g.27333  ORF Transcript_8522/g.27333 Transcript_8522/m.27333 type:complete len:260 (-) Transcript_8522:164-943(-)
MQSLPLSPKTRANWSFVNCGVARRTSATCLPTLEFPTTIEELSPPFSSARILHSSSNFSIFSTVFFKPSTALEFSAFFSVFVALNASKPTRSASSKFVTHAISWKHAEDMPMSSSSSSSSSPSPPPSLSPCVFNLARRAWLILFIDSFSFAYSFSWPFFLFSLAALRFSYAHCTSFCFCDRGGGVFFVVVGIIVVDSSSFSSSPPSPRNDDSALLAAWCNITHKRTAATKTRHITNFRTTPCLRFLGAAPPRRCCNIAR